MSSGDVRLLARDVRARGARVELGSFTLDAGPGIHALVGSALDGVGLALAVLAGAVRHRTGTVSVGGLSPDAASDRIAWVSAHAGHDLARAAPLSADTLLALGWTLRDLHATAPAAATLRDLGLGTLIGRKVDRLAPHEARLLALAAAITSQRPYLLLEEPFAGLDFGSAGALSEQLVAFAARGACVVIGTASRREAARLGATMHPLVQGASMPATDPRRMSTLALTLPDAAPVARALVDALGPEARVEVEGTVVRVQAWSSGAELAAKIGHVLGALHVDVSLLEVDPR